MKKYLLTLLLPFSVSASMMAQQHYLTGVFSTDDQDYKEYSYNADGKLEKMYHLDDAMSVDRFIEYSYNEDGACIEIRYMPYDGMGYDTPSHVVKFLYNDKGQLTDRTVTRPRGEEYYVSGKYEYVYNDKGLVDTMKQVVPESSTSTALKLMAYTVYTYDDNNQMVLDETFSIEDFFSDEVNFIPSSKNSYVYDTKGNLISIVGNMYDPNGGTYLKSYKYEYSYNGDGDKRKMKYYLYNYTSADWFCEHYIDWSYNSDVDIASCVMPEEIEFTWPDFKGMKHMPEEESWFYFDEYEQEFVYAYGYIFEYEEKGGVTAADMGQNEQVAFYTDESGDALVLCGAVSEKVKVKVYDMNGRCVINGVVENTVDVSSLSDGIYLIDINGYKSRFIKK